MQTTVPLIELMNEQLPELIAEQAGDPTPGVTHVSVASVLRRVGVSLFVACVVPAALFYTCFTLWGVGAAMGSALAWAYGAMAWRAVTGRQVSGMLMITATVLTVRTLVAVLAHSDFLYFVQPVLSDGAIGLAFLGSLVVGRPLVARLAGDFYPMCENVAARPAMCGLFRRLTAGWSLFLIFKSGAILWLLMHLSTADFVRTMSAANPVLNLSAAGTTILLAFLVLRREGLVGRPVQSPQPIER